MHHAMRSAAMRPRAAAAGAAAHTQARVAATPNF
jgi:hypothetical protein